VSLFASLVGVALVRESDRDPYPHFLGETRDKSEMDVDRQSPQLIGMISAPKDLTLRTAVLPDTE